MNAEQEAAKAETIEKLQKTCKQLKIDFDSLDIQILELEFAKSDILSQLQRSLKKLKKLMIIDSSGEESN